MKVLLLKFVKNVGREGEVKDVADGLAFNQLIPQQLAVAATKNIIAEYEQKKKGAAEKEVHAKINFIKNVSKVAGKRLVMRLKTNDKGALYQSITPALIRTFLREQHGVIVPEGSVKTKPIREIGDHTIMIEAFGIEEQCILAVERT